jgi:hypothetical protein
VANSAMAGCTTKKFLIPFKLDSSMAPTVTTSRISLGDLTPNNIGQLRVLNSTLFPVNYSDKFYKEVLEVEEFAKLGK